MKQPSNVVSIRTRNQQRYVESAIVAVAIALFVVGLILGFILGWAVTV